MIMPYAMRFLGPSKIAGLILTGRIRSFPQTGDYGRSGGHCKVLRKLRETHFILKKPK